MFRDRLINWQGFGRSRTAPVRENIQAGQAKNEALTPLKIVQGPSSPLKDRILTSFQPKSLTWAELAPIADQTDPLFFSEKIKTGEARYWLDPKVWGQTLTEFVTLAQACDIEDVKFQVATHLQPEEGVSDPEWITLRAVKLNDMNEKVLEAPYEFGISEAGRVSIGNVGEGYDGLGYLNPKRIDKKPLHIPADKGYEATLEETLKSLRR